MYIGRRVASILLFNSLRIFVAKVELSKVFSLTLNTDLGIVKGTWVYGQYTKYEFDGSGNGCMCLEDSHYRYSYQISNNELTLDFENDSIHDCAYTFEINDNTLTIVGGEGTVGGTYKLTKE